MNETGSFRDSQETQDYIREAPKANKLTQESNINIDLKSSFQDSDPLFSVKYPTYRWRTSSNCPRQLISSHNSHKQSKKVVNDTKLGFYTNFLSNKLSYQFGGCLRLFSNYNDEKIKAITKIQKFSDL